MSTAAFVFIGLGSAVCAGFMVYLGLGIYQEHCHPEIQRKRSKGNNTIVRRKTILADDFANNQPIERKVTFSNHVSVEEKKAETEDFSVPTIVVQSKSKKDNKPVQDRKSFHYSENIKQNINLSLQNENTIKKIDRTNDKSFSVDKLAEFPEVDESTMYKLTKKERDNDSFDSDSSFQHYGKLHVYNGASSKLETILSIDESSNMIKNQAAVKEIYSQISSPNLSLKRKDSGAYLSKHISSNLNHESIQIC